jgi:hypothetical protein
VHPGIQRNRILAWRLCAASDTAPALLIEWLRFLLIRPIDHVERHSSFEHFSLEDIHHPARRHIRATGRATGASGQQPLRTRHSVSGVRVGEDLSSLRNSCSANCQNSASRSSGRPACSQSLYARASISCLFGSGIMIAPGWSTVPPFRGLGAYRQDRARPAWRLAGGFKST